MKRISGPLGLWDFPVLNTLIAISEASNKEQDRESFSVKEYNVNRNEHGNIESVEIIKGINDE
jgi:hypothetical protein